MYRVTFTVGGRGTFPIDMLRHDECFPRTQESTAQIIRAMSLRSSQEVITQHGKNSECPNVMSGEWTRCMGHSSLPLVTIELTMLANTQHQQLSVERWRSFGWEVDVKSIRQARVK
jgi:hypothetical protein